jgi:hypothetical protein
VVIDYVGDANGVLGLHKKGKKGQENDKHWFHAQSICFKCKVKELQKYCSVLADGCCRHSPVQKFFLM